MMFARPNVKDSKDHLGELLVEAYKDLWDKNKPLAFKIEAVDLLARFIDHKDVRERLEYFYAREQQYFLKKMMNEILEGTYVIENDDDLPKISNQPLTQSSSKPITNEDLKMQISIYKNRYC